MNANFASPQIGRCMKLIKMHRVSHFGHGWICPALEKPAEMVVGKLRTSPLVQPQVWPLPAWTPSGAKQCQTEGPCFMQSCVGQMVLLDTHPSLQSNLIHFTASETGMQPRAEGPIPAP